jgi:hypothetical protein
LLSQAVRAVRLSLTPPKLCWTGSLAGDPARSRSIPLDPARSRSIPLDSVRSRSIPLIAILTFASFALKLLTLGL